MRRSYSARVVTAKNPPSISMSSILVPQISATSVPRYSRPFSSSRLARASPEAKVSSILHEPRIVLQPSPMLWP